MTPEIVVFLALLALLHWLGDFVLQTNWMAIHKASNSKVRLVHVLTWTASVGLGVGGYLLLTGRPFDNYALFLGINFVAHYATDSVTAPLNTYLRDRDRRHAFFVSLGFDQWLHNATLLATSLLIMR